MNQITLLTGDSGVLFDSLKRASRCIDLSITKRALEDRGFVVQIAKFTQLGDISRYKGHYIIYASSEDSGLFQKSYIEDVMLSLQQAGAILLPRFELLRAHHNKSYMEMRRMLFKDDKFKTIRSQAYPSAESLIASGDLKKLTYPVVIKSSAGAGSSGVRIANDEKTAGRVARKLSGVCYIQHNLRSFKQCELMYNARCLYRKLKGRTDKGGLERPGEKLIVQNYISGMDNDFKVLIFGKKFYILDRKIRNNDFRASGSGNFSFPQELDPIVPVLSFAYDFYQEVDSPLCSIDIGKTGTVCHLIEYQCLLFGPYTIEFSNCWYERDSVGTWEKHEGTSLLEQEYARAIAEYINKKEAIG